MHYLKLALENNLTDYEQKNALSSLIDIYQIKINVSNNEKEKTENILTIIKLTEQLILVQKNIDESENYWHYQSLGKFYHQLSRYNDLYISYEKALECRLNNPSTRNKYLAIMDDCDNLISICLEYINNYQLALRNQLIKHEYTMKYAVPESWDDEDVLRHKKSKLAESYDRLADIYNLLMQYDLAEENFNLALKFHQELLNEYEKELNNNEKYESEKPSIERFIQSRTFTIEVIEQKLEGIKNKKQDEDIQNHIRVF